MSRPQEKTPPVPGSRQQRRAQEREARKQARRVARQLRQQQLAQGMRIPPTTTLGNATSEWKTVEEERQARQGAVEEQIKTYHAVLPRLLERLQRIRDPRHPKTIRHKLTVLMLYGILMFVYQMSSRRQANRDMTLPQFQENLRLLFPELESLPHQDTLNRLLAGIEVSELEKVHVELIQRLIRKKKFARYLVERRYPIAIDGTQKLVREGLWSEECLERRAGSKAEEGTSGSGMQYYVYVLEANLVFANGVVIPLLSEFLSYSEGDLGNNKQDCELKAFDRLAARLKKYFPRLAVLLLLDGLYAKGPVMEKCRGYGWQYMIVLQDDCLPSVWEEVRGLGQLQGENQWQQTWGKRRQRFSWVNGIVYRYGAKDQKEKQQNVHVVICRESWQEVDPVTAAVVEKASRHAWISSVALNRNNLHERCNLGARHRWGIENSLLVEKHHGYQYEHCFSYNWNAMRGYHWLMRMGHLLNTLAQNTAQLARLVRRRGVRGLIQFLRETCTGLWLDAERIRRVLAVPSQLRLE